ncbi:hypothetical protein JW766_05645 [Candidatus Dojkabacteria bacterium]|nr:hypothetical protein [Candidatus Dojkabacteria bacterium]
MDDQTTNPPVNPLGDTSVPTSPVGGGDQAVSPGVTGQSGVTPGGLPQEPTQPGVVPEPVAPDMAKAVSPPVGEPGTDDSLKPLVEGTVTPSETTVSPVGGVAMTSEDQPTGLTGASEEPKEEQPAMEGQVSVPPVSDSAMPGEVSVQAPAQTPEPVTPTSLPSMPAEEPVQPEEVTEPGTGVSPLPTEQAAAPEEKAAEQPAQPIPTPLTTAAAEEKGPVAATDELKKTHEPIIVMPDDYEMGQSVSVKVKVGMIPHVMEDSHYIQSIELLANEQSIGKQELTPKDNPVPEAEFQVALAAGMTLKAVVYCNVHGKWEATRTV